MKPRKRLLEYVSTNTRKFGGGSGIRTLEGFNSLPVFKTGAFDHSANPPRVRWSSEGGFSRFRGRKTITWSQCFANWHEFWGTRAVLGCLYDLLWVL